MISKVSTFLGPNGLYQGISGTPSLVLSLDSNNILSYPGTGTTWSDLSIRKNNGILNDVSSVTGSIPNTSLSFNGTGSYISFTQSNGIPSGNSQYTIETWFNSNSYDVFEQGAIIGWGSVGDDNMSNVLRLSANGLTNYWWNNDITFSLSGTSSMIVGNWYYAVATYDGTDRKLFLNGELKSTDTPGTHSVSDTSTLKVGHFYNSYFDGKISKIRVSDKSISGSRVLSNFNSSKIDYGYTFGSMTFDETQGSYLISSSPDYAFGLNDFTIESFFRAATSSGDSYSGVISLRPNGAFNSGVGINIRLYDTPNPEVEFFADGEFGTYSITNDTWYHAAISRNSGTSSFFINGELIKQITDTYNYDCNDLVVGRYFTNFNDYHLNGIISNVRVINGTGLYTGTFSVPEVQLGATYSNTKFLINSQQTTPTADVSGLLHSVTASNIGWTSSLPSSYVTENLQFYVDAGLPSSYSGTGTTWYDISGNSRNLTMNSLSYSSNNGGYIIFDGSHTADSSAYSINFSNGFTVEVVAKFSGSDYEGLFAFNEPMNGNYINVQAQGGTNIRWEVDSGSSFTTTNSLTSNTWYHVTCVYEGDSNNTSATARIYINGVENNTSSLFRSGQNQTSNFVLGEWDDYLTGNIALSRMYNKVLNSTEVLQNFNATKDRFGL